MKVKTTIMACWEKGQYYLFNDLLSGPSKKDIAKQIFEIIDAGMIYDKAEKIYESFFLNIIFCGKDGLEEIRIEKIFNYMTNEEQFTKMIISKLKK